MEEFFHQEIDTLIPVAQANYWTDQGRFRVLVPDFSGDNRAGEIQFWASNPITGKIVARLLPDMRSSADRAMPDQTEFHMCGTQEARGRDRFGFAIRGEEHLDCGGLIAHLVCRLNASL